MAKKRRSIHALLAGINDYPPPVTPLRGCIHDLESWEQYLRNEATDNKLSHVILKNAEVTKQALVNAFMETLDRANKNDIVFFYFSGHGTREDADPVFTEIEQDNALESLVCYDSIQYRKGTYGYDLLSDKELHYIISTYSKEGTHVLTIFDCCHSGGMTRNMLLGDVAENTLERRHVPVERMSFVAPMRRWDQFVFGNAVERDTVEKHGWMQTVPQRRHITISACQNDESAFEQNGKGIFTANMLDVLRRSGGALSYYDLQSRVRAFTQNQFRQTPEIYVVKGHEDDLFLSFLDTPAANKGFGCTCFYKKDDGWVIDLGLIHGVSAYSGPVDIEDGREKWTAQISQVHANYASLSGDQLSHLNPEQGYNATIRAHFSATTTFYFDSETDDVQKLSELSAETHNFLKGNAAAFAIADAPEHAGYLVRIVGHKILICVNDDQKRPVTEISSAVPEAAQQTLQYMRHIAQWEYVRSLSNPEFTATEYPVDFTVYRIGKDGSKTELPVRGDTVEFDYEQNSSGEWVSRIKVCVTNRSKVKYYCAILYLSNTFQIYGNMLDGKVAGLGPGESAWIHNGQPVELDLEEHIVAFNYPVSVFYLKLLANVTSFQTEVFEQAPLPPPRKSIDRGVDGAARGIKMREEEAVKEVEWFTRAICFKGRNPNYIEELIK